MIVYSHDSGYGNVNLKEVEDAIRALPLDTPGRQSLLELRFDYEVLLSVIEGKGCLFRHEDRSETRRFKLY